MPTFIFNDQFTGYSLGPGLPSGWAADATGAAGEFDEPASPTPAPGFYEKSGVIFKLSGLMEFPPSSGLFIGTTSATTVWWTTLGVPDTASAGFAIGLLQLGSTNPTGSHARATLVSVVLEADYSVSVIVNGAPKINTLNQVVFPFTWQIFQLVCQFGVTTILGVAYVNVTFSLAINGQIWASGTAVVSSTQVSTLWDMGSGINQWLLSGGGILGANTYYSEIAATTTAEMIPTYPNPASIVNSLVSQLAIDVIKLPPTTIARVSQIALEVAKKPSNRNARVSQIIVEIIKRKSASSGGWLTYEA